MKRFRHLIHSSYLKGFLPYLLCNLIPLVTFLIFGMVTTAVVRNQNNIIIESEQEQIVTRVNDIFSEIKAFDRKLYDEITPDLLNSQISVTDYWSDPRFSQLRALFSTLPQENRYFSDCFLYVPDADCVISQHGIKSRTALINSLGLHADPFVDPDEAVQDLADSDYLFCRSDYRIANTDVSICYLVEKALFLPQSPSAFFSGNANVYLFNFRNRLVFTTADGRNTIASPEDLKALRRHLVYNDTLSFASSIYHVAITVPYGFSTLFPTLLWMLMLAILLLNVVLSVVLLRRLARNNYKPMINISRLLSENQLAYEYDIIEQSIRTLIETNAQLKNDIATQKHAISDFLLTELLKNNFSEKLEFILDKYGIKFRYENFVVLSLYVYDIPTNSSNLQRLRATLISNLDALLEGNDVYHTDDNTRLVFILNTAQSQDSYLMQLSQRIAYTLSFTKAKIHFNVKVGISGIHTGYSTLNQAYIESLQALYISEVDPNASGIYLYGSLKNIPGYLDADLDDSLVESVLHGDLQEALDVLNNIISKLKYTSRSQQYEYLYRLCGALLRIPYLLKLDDTEARAFQEAIPLPSLQLEPEDVKEKIAAALTDVMSKNIKYRTNSSDNVIRIAMEYTQKNYSDSNLSLNDICSYLGYTPNYFSTLFKQKQGVSWLNYLHALRIEEAKRLIGEGVSANECFQRVGYTNLRSFSRTFKKITGMTVSEYRAEH